MRVLLDTCTFLWVVSGSDELSDNARKEFQNPANEVFLSSVSGWEISVKYLLRKLSLPEPPARFVPAQRTLHRIDSLALSENAVLILDRLPVLHKDPFDRMLICQAIADGLVLLTPDPLVT